MKPYKYILYVVLIAIIFIPIALNLLCLTKSPIPVVGDGRLWLSFWGSYLGGMIAVLSTIYVLYKSHDREIKRKKYDDNNRHFESLCKDLGKLSSVISTDLFSFYFMNLRNPNDFMQIMSQIGSLDEKIKVSYNEFCIKYAHHGGKEKDDFLNACNHYAVEIRNCVSVIQEAIVDLNVGRINEIQYNDKIHKVCKDLEALGDITQELFTLASLWKKKEWFINEELKQQYILD